MGKRKASAKFLAAGEAWRAHVKKTMAENPGLSFKMVLKKAKRTYKKSSVSKLRNSRYSIQIRKKTRVANRKKTKKPKKTKRVKQEKSFFGF
tara:strand:+ start:379 stop:654 length:276 start_codon:yes stop_codon:yes gene_type:complete